VGDLGRARRAALATEPRRRTAAEPLSPEDLGFAMEEDTFTDRAQRLLQVLLSLVNGERVIPFRDVTDEEPHDKVARLMELLHLDAQGKVRLFQEEFLGEILVEVPDGSQGPC
jgi:chromatin segregation and condensation protein Rec8/ScpA/Scc1 (kleisin family)